MSNHPDTTLDGCAGCDLGTDRRRFIGAALGFAFAAALPARLAHALTARGAEHRYPIPAGDSVAIDADNGVILVRWTGKVYAFNLACPHQNTALRWQEEEHRFQCPKHKSRYQPDGTFIEGRATRSMDRLAIRRDGDAVLVELDTMYKQDENAAAWAAAFVTL
jgi:nitrite reductase/ring-hydroxylating ferredoxin subunit